ncbi:DUF6332 family protein [Streptomyces sp. DSM 15324]|uniref:DUF6332 family protein n=1 Tax=Streptomyces sp. DSM 15324 TaxID=1739111 RepID=UPI0007461534|nr:DUF6332 family protein [Streptomyces sp. DSM 15324]KUO07820.1 hypothetical protein AQJ58_33215 [Streptomyces sp. DSM 15324]
MSGYGGRRNRAERDAITVEIGYASFSAAFAAAVVFGAIAGPVLVFELPDAVDRLLPRVALVPAAAVFVVRLVSVLWRFPRAAQPSQPGRTRPDS